MYSPTTHPLQTSRQHPWEVNISLRGINPEPTSTLTCSPGSCPVCLPSLPTACLPVEALPGSHRVSSFCTDRKPALPPTAHCPPSDKVPGASQMSLRSCPTQRPGVSLPAASCMGVGRGGTQGGPLGPRDSASWKDGPAAYPLTVLLVTPFSSIKSPFDRR